MDQVRDRDVQIGLLHLEVFGRFFAAVRHDFIFNLLAFVEIAQSGALDSRDVNEHILAAALRLDKAVTFGRVEPLHSACSHNKSPSRLVDVSRHTSVGLTSR